MITAGIFPKKSAILNGLLAAHFKLLIDAMKTTKIFALLVGVSSLATLTSIAGPSITVQIGTPPPMVVAPAPPPVVVSTVPDAYVWDGVEFVGVVGDQYYYLGTGNVWLPFDALRTARFHDWERVHADWHAHAVRNDLYRRDAHGHDVPFRDDHGHDVINQDNHDKDHDKGHDYGH
jgi:hypothetical protein